MRKPNVVEFVGQLMNNELVHWTLHYPAARCQPA